jgi:hypothetical protein
VINDRNKEALTTVLSGKEGDWIEKHYFAAQAMPLRFTTGGERYIMLPKSGSAEDLLSGMTNEYFNV